MVNTPKYSSQHDRNIQRELIAGDNFQVNEDGCKDMGGNFVVRFSKKFQQTILSQKKAGYDLKSTGKISFVVYWQMEEGVEVRVVLPEVRFITIEMLT